MAENDLKPAVTAVLNGVSSLNSTPISDEMDDNFAKQDTLINSTELIGSLN